MAASVNPKTLFHLVPDNQNAQDALSHPDNRRFVSASDHGFGLEVGYHVPSLPRGYVITRLGRNADLILPKNTREHPMSAIHVAFEINPATKHVLLSVRSKRVSSVTFEALPEEGGQDAMISGRTPVVRESIIGDGVILYDQNYRITIASYAFRLIWRVISRRNNAECLRDLAIEGCRTALELAKGLRSRDQPTETSASEALSWHITRLRTAQAPRFRDIPHLRQKLGGGSFGTVYSAVDQTSGHMFAIKVVRLDEPGILNVDAARAYLHREIKIMEQLNHPHIIEFLGHQHFDTLRPEIFMPLRQGTLTKLARIPSPPAAHDQLCADMMEQMLSALDYLASENLVHRDLKPDNILYQSLGEGRYHFQLADFGLANHTAMAKTHCGTPYFQAPEFYPQVSKIEAKQSPKVDIWSLFATLIAFRSRFQKFPPVTDDYGVVLKVLRTEAQLVPNFEPMARVDPNRRASAAQMLVRHFNGRGLTTPVSRIPPLDADGPPAAGPSGSPQTRLGDFRRPSPSPQQEGVRPLIVYPPPRRSPRAHNPRRLRAQPPQLQDRLRVPAQPPPPYSPSRAANVGQPAMPQAQQTRAPKDGVAKRRPNRSSGSSGVAKSSTGEKAMPPRAQPPFPDYGQMPGSFVE